MHSNCYTSLSSKHLLSQAETRKRKLNEERDKAYKKPLLEEATLS